MNRTEGRIIIIFYSKSKLSVNQSGYGRVTSCSFSLMRLQADVINIKSISEFAEFKLESLSEIL